MRKTGRQSGRKFKINDPDFEADTLKNITVHAKKEAFIAAAQGCDVFFEIIFEDLELKCSVLAEILPLLPEKVVFWSNTSGLDINAEQ